MFHTRFFNCLPELNRLKFVLERDGAAKAVFFAKQTLKTYRYQMKLSKKHEKRNGAFSHLSIPEFKKGAMYSCCVFKLFIELYDEK
jgi:hypothetical protein